MLNTSFEIPPMVRDHQIISAFQVPADARIHAVRPHMNLRGKDNTATLIRPDGSRQVLLHVPNWNDFWQYYYVLDEPANVPAGSLVEYVTTYDNSPANALNPDPSLPVRWGQQVWEEMQLLYVNWTEINNANRDDDLPIQISSGEAFASGLFDGE